MEVVGIQEIKDKSYNLSSIMYLNDSFSNCIALLGFGLYIIDMKIGISSNIYFQISTLMLIYYFIQNFYLKNYTKIKGNFWSRCVITFIHIGILFLIAGLLSQVPFLIKLLPKGYRLYFFIFIFAFALDYAWRRIKKFSFKKFILIWSSSLILRAILILLMPIVLPEDWAQYGIDLLTTSILSIFLEEDLITPYYLDDNTYEDWRNHYINRTLPNPNNQKKFVDMNMKYVADRLALTPTTRDNLAYFPYNSEELCVLLQLYNISYYNSNADIIFVSPRKGQVYPVPFHSVIGDYYNNCSSDHTPYLFTKDFKISVYKALGPMTKEYEPVFTGMDNENVLINQRYIENGVAKSIVLAYQKQAEIEPSFVKDWSLNDKVRTIRPFNRNSGGIEYPKIAPARFNTRGTMYQTCVKMGGRHIPLSVNLGTLKFPHEIDYPDSPCLYPYYIKTLDSLIETDLDRANLVPDPYLLPNMPRAYAVVNSPILSQLDFDNLDWKKGNEFIRN